MSNKGMNILLKFKRGSRSPSKCVSDTQKSLKSADTKFTSPDKRVQEGERNKFDNTDPNLKNCKRTSESTER